MGENCDIFSGFWFYWGRGLAISRRRAAIPVGRTLFFPWSRPTGCRLVFSEPFSLCLNFKPNRGIGWRFAGFPVQGWDSSYPSREKPSSTCVMLMGLPAGRKA